VVEKVLIKKLILLCTCMCWCIKDMAYLVCSRACPLSMPFIYKREQFK